MGRAASRARFGAVLAVALIAGGCRDIMAPEPPSVLAPTDIRRTLTGATTTDIFPGAPTNGLRGDARGLNDAGQVTGALLGFPSETDARPYRFTPGAGYVQLTGMCCGTAFGSDINDAGVVAGTTQVGASSGVRAYRAVGTTMIKLDSLSGSSVEGNTRAFAINASGQIVGDATTTSLDQHAVLWSAGNLIQDLGTLGGSYSSAIDINDAGQVIGWSELAGNASDHFFIWSAGTGMQDLTLVLGTPTSLVGINDAGQIAGTYTVAGTSHAFLYTPGSGVRDLGTLGGTTSAATGLNDDGDVVGRSTLANGATHAFLWTATGGMEDITAIAGIPDVHLLNNSLQTVTGRDDFTVVANASPRLVQLTVSASNGAPTAQFTPTCKKRQCVFDATASTDDVRIVKYTWAWGTGRTETTSKPVARNNFHPGSYVVTLTVTDGAGLTGTTTRTVTID